AMPARPIWSDDRLISSRPSSCTEPVRWPTMPMIDLSVVVLPAPLRPSSVTTSPARTSKLTPCSTCDSPYQACRFSIASSAPLGMANAEISLAHLGVRRHGRVVAFGEHAAARQHRDAVAQIRHHAEIVLDHQDGAVGRDPLDQRRDAADVLMAHAGGRLVE